MGARFASILREPFGLKSAEVLAMSIPAVIAGEAGTELRFRVMHPVLSMESRAHNTAFLAKYAGPQGLKQLRASVLCAREFLREILADGHVRDVLRLNERIFRFRRHQEAARLVLARQGIDVFEASSTTLRCPRRSGRYGCRRCEPSSRRVARRCLARLLEPRAFSATRPRARRGRA
jgi:hypothetical protein